MKLRKMLGDVQSEVCRELMSVMSSQSKHTLAYFAITYAKKNYLSIYQAVQPEQASSFDEVFKQCEHYLDGETSLNACRPLLREVRLLSSKTKGEVARAAARALAVACATIQTPTNALGFLFYGAAAKAYEQFGLQASQETYDQSAIKSLEDALAYLKSIMIENEQNPSQLDWNC